MAEPGFRPRPFHCPTEYCNHSATQADCDKFHLFAILSRLYKKKEYNWQYSIPNIASTISWSNVCAAWV